MALVIESYRAASQAWKGDMEGKQGGPLEGGSATWNLLWSFTTAAHPASVSCVPCWYTCHWAAEVPGPDFREAEGDSAGGRTWGPGYCPPIGWTCREAAMCRSWAVPACPYTGQDFTSAVQFLRPNPEPETTGKGILGSIVLLGQVDTGHTLTNWEDKERKHKLPTSGLKEGLSLQIVWTFKQKQVQAYVLLTLNVS